VEFRTVTLGGPIEIVPRRIEDERGYFSETFRENEFAKHVSKHSFVQDNQSLSIIAGTIRGIHFQSHPAAQGKLVRCLAGRVFDVAVDLRGGSDDYGHWMGTVLSSDENNQLWVPAGFGHAFCTLEPNSIIAYRVTNYYSAENDKGVAWDDPDIGIEWPVIANPNTLSAKDRTQPALSQSPRYFSEKD
jgi:dTDP-4-dehydrorhamnose 3,5-epimerase